MNSQPTSCWRGTPAAIPGRLGITAIAPRAGLPQGLFPIPNERRVPLTAYPSIHYANARQIVGGPPRGRLWGSGNAPAFEMVFDPISLVLGNMDAKRDWGHAKDYVEMQWLMLQQETPEDFVIATGVQYSVRDFVDAAAKELGIEIRWEGQGVDEKGYDAHGRCIVAVDPRYFRPTEVETLLGDPSKAKNTLGWTPKISFDELVAEMVREDLKAAERDELVKKHGYKTMDYHE